MKKILLAWRVSATWMRVTLLIVLLLLVKAALDLTSPAAPVVARVEAPRPIDPVKAMEEIARRACQAAIVASATNRSSVDFHLFSFPPQITKLSDGPIVVLIKFSAKNGFGSESTSIGKCVLSPDGQTVIGLTAVDSR